MPQHTVMYATAYITKIDFFPTLSQKLTLLNNFTLLLYLLYLFKEIISFTKTFNTFLPSILRTHRIQKLSTSRHQSKTILPKYQSAEMVPFRAFCFILKVSSCNNPQKQGSKASPAGTQGKTRRASCRSSRYLCTCFHAVRMGFCNATCFLFCFALRRRCLRKTADEEAA